VRAFAERTGVTVKTLRHYDRLGLLRPARTPAGHRVYSPDDLDRLRRIRALRQIDVRLSDMRTLLDADRWPLLAHLSRARDAVGRERERLDRVTRALAIVDESLRHGDGDDDGLTRLADVIEMASASVHLKRYFTDNAWRLAKRFYEDWPQPDWIALCRDIEAAIPGGPATAHAGELLARWNALARAVWRGFAADLQLSRELHEGFARAWRDRAAWPAIIQRRFEDYRLGEVCAFVREASLVDFNRRAASA
jgi:DNA-binding transcriptional MerR regulator